MSKAAPSAEAGLPAPLALQVEKLCNRIEAAWRAGQRPSIENHVRDLAEQLPAVLCRTFLVWAGP